MKNVTKMTAAIVVWVVFWGALKVITGYNFNLLEVAIVATVTSVACSVTFWAIRD